MININFREVVGVYSIEYPFHDPTTPWYEWNMYIECCKSLDVPGQPSLGRFMAYRRYLKSVGVL